MKLFAVFAVTVAVTSIAHANQTAPFPEASPLAQQRANYQKALESLRRGASSHYRRHKTSLRQYPLYPYLEYAELSGRLHKLPRRQVDRFLNRYRGQRIADKLRLRWLKALKSRRRGADFIRYYQANLADTKLACYYQYARYRTGDQRQRDSALQQALKLWSVGKSQPKDCDKLFDLLLDSGKVNDQAIWRRYSKALSNRQYKLARYLQKRIKQQPWASWAANASETSKKPRLIGNYDNFRDQGPEMLAVIEHNLRRLATENASRALVHWAHYQQTHPFTIRARGRIVERLTRALYKEGRRGAADEYLSSNLEIVKPQLLEWRVRQALANQQWQTARRWIARLPTEYQQEPRWRYWSARLAQQLNGEDPAPVYAELAQRRSFYGFLASEWLTGNYTMNHQPVAIDEAAIAELAALPGMQRARELHYHGDTLDARREWQYASRQFDERQWQLAGELARRWGWSNQSIVSMIRASHWNDIAMRFPLTYRQQITEQSTKLNLDSHLLMALARQESALAADAVSPAGARGLMQLMPATAKQTARKHKIPYRSKKQLLTPEVNIALGTHYYRELLDRFDNNRILATAAYNAGPNRVSRWLKKSDQQLPFDAWIETIPFKETRNYVQNVLAFSAIYAHLLGDNSRILAEQEKARLL